MWIIRQMKLSEFLHTPIYYEIRMVNALDNKMKRNERIGAIVKVLCDRPNRVFTLSYFTEMFNSAKSTVSEDLVVVKKLMDDLSLGKVETIAGAAGGVKYVPCMSQKRKMQILNEICNNIKDNKRIIPGGFLYIADILYDPTFIKDIGEIFAEMFSYCGVDYVLTVETKGIPLAMMTANGLNVPLVVARNENRVTEGSTISINYVSGSSGKVQTMYVSKKAIPAGSKVLIIDDFMRAGGTIKGMVDLVNELGSTVEGIGVLMETLEPDFKMIEGYTALLTMGKAEKDNIVVFPNEKLLRG